MAAFADTDVPQAGANPIVFDQTAQTDNLIVLTAGEANTTRAWPRLTMVP